MNQTIRGGSHLWGRVSLHLHSRTRA